MSSKSTKTISIVGTGYVGLTLAAILSNSGFKVFCIDIDEKKIKTVQSGKSFFYEKGLDELVKAGVDSGMLKATTSYSEAIPNSEIIFSCVGTPDNPDGSTNLDFIYKAAESVAKHAKGKMIFVQKSTVPVGTGELLLTFMKGINSKLEVDYISNPEFLSEGTAVFDTLNMNRVVIGGNNPKAVQEIASIFEKIDEFSKNTDLEELFEHGGIYSDKKIHSEKNFNDRVIKTNLQSAELIKVTANSFLALKISFANTIAMVADATGADVAQVMNGVGSDERIGRSFLYAGLGWGGGCFPKDVSGLIKFGELNDVRMDILEASYSINTVMVEYAAKRLLMKIGSLEDKDITLLGLSFKPGTNDVRKSQSIALANLLSTMGANLTVFDPKSIDEAKPLLNEDIKFKKTVEDAIKDADVVILATEWKEFINYDWRKAKELMKGKIVFDARNVLSKEEIEKAGLDYIGMGRE